MNARHPEVENPALRYSNVAVALHWLIAAFIVANLTVGLLMGSDLVERASKFALYQWHKSLGVTVLLLAALRLTWRLMHAPPPLPESVPRWERLAARATHWLLYALMIGLPLSGWVIVSASTLNIPTVLYGVAPWPHLPMEWVEDRKALSMSVAAAHSLAAWLLIAALALHIGAALKHHFYDKDEVLRRMLPRWLPVIVLAICAAAPMPAEAATWKIDPEKSEITFTATQAGENFTGRFEKFDVEIDFDPAKPETGSISAIIDMASAVTGDKQRDEALPQADWFDAGRFPSARFTSKSIRKTGENAYEMTGILSVKEASHEITLPFTLTEENGATRADVEIVLMRNDFKVGTGEWTSDEWVGYEVKVKIVIFAMPQPGLAFL